MNCRDFERDWNLRLDARDSSPLALDGHAAACPVCRALDARFRALSRAVGAPSTIEPPSSGFVDRVLAASERAETPVVWRFPRWTAAVAAAVVAMVAIGLYAGRVGRKAPEVASVPIRVRAIDPKDLSEALADAGAATWDLAREASAPAARVGRQMIGSAAALPGASASVSMPEGVVPSAEVWKRVESRVSAGAGPIGGTARHAFGFLLALAPDDGK